MTAGAPYIPDLNGWIDYYGQQAGAQLPSDKQLASSNPVTTSINPVATSIDDASEIKGVRESEHNCVDKESATVENQASCSEETVLSKDMGTEVQLVTPVQAAVAQANALKKRRRSENGDKGKRSGQVKKSKKPKKAKGAPRSNSKSQPSGKRKPKKVITCKKCKGTGRCQSGYKKKAKGSGQAKGKGQGTSSKKGKGKSKGKSAPHVKIVKRDIFNSSPL
jgi:hypothetical protein